MRLFEDYRGLRGRPWLGHAFALIAFAAALVIRFRTDGALPPGFPYITFFPAVILTAFIAGLTPAILCAVLSGLSAWYFFIPPSSEFTITYPVAVAMAFYVFIVAIDIALIEATRRTTARLADERRLTARLLEQQRTMFQELQHRVANNMTFVAAILRLERRRTDRADTIAALDSAASRIETMSSMHRRLYDPSTAEAPIDAYLRDLASDLTSLSGAEGVEVRVEADPVTLDISRLMTLSLLVTELVVNALKHAFVGRPSGCIRIILKRQRPGRLVLEVSDDGRGYDPAGPSDGLGSRIARDLARQLGGDLQVTVADGVSTIVDFPEAPET
ncbi:MAG: histidine kinase dimerization/phosphoacceptor domain -containing protein [Phenylobacterium sp.]|nr:histidine kinase dimerization/phosphoacceptor domain -containing protein [Phenylobacterium sp.]